MSVDVADLQINVESASIVVANSRLDQFQRKSGQAATASRKLESAMGKLRSVAMGLAAVFGGIQLTKWAKDSVLSAARFETLGIVMKVAGANAGYSTQQMDEFDRSLRTTGISMLEARQNLARLSAVQLDVTKSTEMARAAQNLAVVAYTDSSQAFNRLVHGIISGNRIVLRNLGLEVNFKQAYEAGAAALGKNVEALSEREKLLIRQNAVLQAAAGYEGIYEASMNTASKQLGSFARYLSDFAVLVGQFTLDAFTEAIFGSAEAIKAMNVRLTEMMESGEIKEWAKAITIQLKRWIPVIVEIAKIAGAIFVGFAFSKIVAGIAAVTASLRVLMTTTVSLGAAGSVAFGWLVLLVGAIYALFNMEGITNWLLTNFESVRDIIGDIAKITVTVSAHIATSFKSTVTFFKNIWTNTFDWFARRWADVLDMMATIVDKSDMGTGLFSSVEESLRGYAKEIRQGHQGGKRVSFLPSEEDLAKMREDIEFWHNNIEANLAHYKNKQQEQNAGMGEFDIDAWLANRNYTPPKIDDGAGGGGPTAEEIQDRLDNINKFESEYTEKIIEMRDGEVAAMKYRLDREKESFDSRLDELEIFGDERQKHTDRWKEYATLKEQEIADRAREIEEERLRNSKVWSDGMIRGFRDYAESATDMAAQIEDVVEKSMKGMEDQLVSFVTTGKMEFSDLANSIIADMARIMIRSTITGPLAEGLGSIFGSLFHGGGLVGGVGGMHRNMNPLLFAGAPRFHNGLFGPGEYPAILQRGERVVTPKQWKDITSSDSGSVVDMSVSSSNVEVNIHNYSGQEVTQQKSVDNYGNTRLDVMVGDAAAKQMATPGSSLNRAVRSTTGVQQQVVRR